PGVHAGLRIPAGRQHHGGRGGCAHEESCGSDLHLCLRRWRYEFGVHAGGVWLPIYRGGGRRHGDRPGRSQCHRAARGAPGAAGRAAELLVPGAGPLG
ncbi:unnamed protein product, partial [Effrenium voratum]